MFSIPPGHESVNVTVKELQEILATLPQNAIVSHSSGEGGTLIVVTAKNGKFWNVGPSTKK